MREVYEQIRISSDSLKVVGGLFDSYLNNSTAPYHLLAGLVAHLLDDMFSKLPDRETKITLDILLYISLKDIYSESQSSMYNF